MIRAAIVIGSTRPGRKGEAVARWVYEIASKRNDAEFEVVDIKDYDLPLLDEPLPPAMNQYSKPHTKAWAAKIGSFDAFVFVTPEYNHGCPGLLWRFPKPAACKPFDRGSGVAAGDLPERREQFFTLAGAKCRRRVVDDDRPVRVARWHGCSLNVACDED
jgi:hypothetical protein